MRIAMVGPFGLSPKGTMSVRALPLAQALARRGHEVSVVVAPWDNPGDSGRADVREGVLVRNIRVPGFLQPATISALLVREALRFGPDVIHVFKPKGYSGMAAYLLRLLGRQFVLDSDDWEGAGGWNAIGGYSAPYRAFFALQQATIPKIAAGVTVASRTLEWQMRGYGLPADRVFYLPNGASKTRYAGWGEARLQKDTLRAVHGLGAGPVILLYTRFFEFDPQRVIEMLAGVVGEAPDARLLVIGTGFFNEQEKLDRLAEAAGLSANIRQLGWVSEDELATHLAMADVAIYPYDDNLVNRAKCSVKLIDLMAAGLPVVADAVGQNCEYLEDGVSGLLIAPGETSRFLQAVVDLIQNPERRLALGRAAQQQIWSRFDWDDLSPAAEAAYRIAGS